MAVRTGVGAMTPDQRSSLRRFKPYPAYKDSGIEWLGKIPAHWTVAPLYGRYDTALRKMLDASRISGEHLRPYLRNVDVQWDRINLRDLPEMDFHTADRLRYRLRSGDLLVCEGGEVGRTAVWTGALQECYYQKALHRLRPYTDSDIPRFFYYVMYASSEAGRFTAGTNPNTIDHLTAVQLSRYRFAFPPSNEQANIADFLDRETTKIDAMVAKKERLIELLREKRRWCPV
jgi:type I restriction enzyme S subunit